MDCDASISACCQGCNPTVNIKFDFSKIAQSIAGLGADIKQVGSDIEQMGKFI